MSGELSVKMSAWLAHVRAASERGMTLSVYAAQEGLSAGALYKAKSTLMQVGAWPRSSVPKGGSSRKQRAESASRFVPARLTDAVSCRLSHVSGWTLTCESLPPTQWLNSLLGVAHAA